MVPWIQVYSNLPTHDKTYALAERLKVPQYAAVGLMVCLWAWASVNAPDGDITAYTARAIADACGWKKSPIGLLDALKDVCLVDETDGKRSIHNWAQYAEKLIDILYHQKKQSAERVKRYRDSAKNTIADGGKRNGNAQCNVTETLCNAVTVPDQTRHNITNILPPTPEPLQVTNPPASQEASAAPVGAGGFDFKGIPLEVRVALTHWIAYKARGRGKPVDYPALRQMVLDKTKELGEQAVIDAINQSMANGYSGIAWDKGAKPPDSKRPGKEVGAHRYEQRTPDKSELDGLFVDLSKVQV